MNNPPKMTIAREVIDKFLDRYAGQAMNARGTIPTKEAGEAARAIYARKKPSDILADMFALKARGLGGVRLCVSDAHQGLQNAIARVLGCRWQRGTGPRPRRLRQHAAG